MKKLKLWAQYARGFNRTRENRSACMDLLSDDQIISIVVGLRLSAKTAKNALPELRFGILPETPKRLKEGFDDAAVQELMISHGRFRNTAVRAGIKAIPVWRTDRL